MDATSYAAPRATTSLRDELASALPVGFRCFVRYLHSRPQRCEPLFSPLPHGLPEKTRLASHFLTISIPSPDDSKDVFVYAVEVLIYTTSRLTTMFVSKADSTGYLAQVKPSPVRTISTTFLRWLSNRDRIRRPGVKQVLSLFGRAQGQYLFPGSAENGKKHVLDDRQLIKWWVRVLDSLFARDGGTSARRRGFITVPGCRGLELRQFLPPERAHWSEGHPLLEIARTRDVPEHAPTRCLLPRFPDDPKARFMQDLDDEVGLVEDAGASATASPSKRKNGRWKSIHNLDRFWEAMEFRQECSSGRVVSFLWLVTGDEDSNNVFSQASDDTLSIAGRSQAIDSQELSQQSTIPDSQTSNYSLRHKKKQKLTGPVIPRLPRVKGSSDTCKSTSSTNHFDDDGVCLTSDGYDQAMQTLLHLDFGSLEVAIKSTVKWAAEVASICSLPKQAWVLDIQGQAASESVHMASMAGKFNDLGSMIRKKKRVLNTVPNVQSSDVQAGIGQAPQAVNVLGNGLIRKKSKIVE